MATPESDNPVFHNQNKFLGLIYLFCSIDKHLEMAFNHDLYMKSLNPDYVAPSDREKADINNSMHAEVLRICIIKSLRRTFIVCLVLLLIAWCTNLIGQDLPLDFKKLVFFLAAIFGAFSAALTISPAPLSYKKITFAEQIHTSLMAYSFYATGFTAILASLM